MRIFARLINVRFVLFVSLLMACVSFVPPASAATETVWANWGYNTSTVSVQGGSRGGVFQFHCFYRIGVRCLRMQVTNINGSDTDFVAWRSGVIVGLGRYDNYVHECAYHIQQLNSFQVRCSNTTG